MDGNSSQGDALPGGDLHAADTSYTICVKGHRTDTSHHHHRNGNMYDGLDEHGQNEFGEG
jgi:hypothetical protein